MAGTVLQAGQAARHIWCILATGRASNLQSPTYWHKCFAGNHLGTQVSGAVTGGWCPTAVAANRSWLGYNHVHKPLTSNHLQQRYITMQPTITLAALAQQTNAVGRAAALLLANPKHGVHIHSGFNSYNLLVHHNLCTHTRCGCCPVQRGNGMVYTAINP